MNFKLLAIRTLDECNTTVLNILKPDTTYSFDEAYIYDQKTQYLVSKSDVKSLPDDFFYKRKVRKSSLSYVNIQAVVGKNGSGKSSIVELLLRILNNFFKQYRLSEVTDNLIYSRGVKAELYFLFDNNIFKIYVDSTNLKDKLISNETAINVRFYDAPTSCYKTLSEYLAKKKRTSNNDEDNLKQILQNLFFSMYINYSLYGMDSNVFKDETALKKINLPEDNTDVEKISWLDSIFHKNDGYQTPVVIHPYRKEAQINVHKEKYLLNQRLVSLIITEDKYIKLTEKITFKKLKLLTVEQNILYRKTDEILNEGYSSYHVNKYDNNIFYIKNNLNDTEEEKLRNEKTKIDLIHDFYRRISLRYNLVTIQKKDGYADNELYKQFLLYFVSYEEIKSIDLSDGEVREKVEKVVLRKFSSEYQQKLEFIFNFFINYTFSQLSKILTLDVYYDYWQKKLNVNETIDDEFEKTLFEYIVFKSYKTIRYPKFGRYGGGDALIGFVPNDFQLSEQIKKDHKKFLDELVKDTTHVSTKLHQSVKILEIKDKAPRLFNLYKREYSSFHSSNIKDSLDIQELRDCIQEAVKEVKVEPIYLIPPPIFTLDIEVSSTELGNLHSIKKISSGEFQFLTMISSIIYHLKNIDSVEEGFYQGKLDQEYLFQYRNVNIILDEIELYFHPEFQRNFIHEILERLKDMTFESIEAISILFLTHSPFILSDVPSQNVLKLDEGKPKLKDESNSFGSNIHDLLADEFFLKDGFMGEFAASKINDLFKHIKKFDDDKKGDIELLTEEKYHVYRNEVELIGEKVLREPLLNLLDKIMMRTPNNREFLIKKYTEILNKLNDNKYGFTGD